MIRLVLVLLLSLIAVANVAVVMLPPPVVSETPEMKFVTIAFSAGIMVAAFMLVVRSQWAFVPYVIVCTINVCMHLVVGGGSAITEAAVGFGILALFFLPSVRTTDPAW